MFRARSRILPVVASQLACLAVCGCASGPQTGLVTAQPAPLGTVTTMAIRELIATRKVPQGFALSERSFTISITTDAFERFRIYSVTAPALGHGEHYLIGQSSKAKLYKLGGFRAIDLVRFANDLGINLLSASDTASVLAAYTWLADPYGARSVYGPSALPITDPEDAAFSLLDEARHQCSGHHTVTTGLAIQAPSVSERPGWHNRWQALCYTFSFDQQGKLMSWDVEELGSRTQTP